MTKTKNTKRALLVSILSMLLCCALLIGSTFAWFTDSASSGKNSIVAGNLDVELYHTNTIVKTEEKVDANTKLFVNVNGDDVIWEPGAMVYENFIVKNVGTLALKYTLSLNVADFNTVTVGDEEKSLKDVLKVAIVDDALPDTITRDYAETLDFDYTIEDFAKPGKIAAKGADDTYAIVIYWEDTLSDNDYNLEVGQDPLYIDLGVKLVAAQDTVEEDGFGNDYDKDAAYPTIAVADSNTLLKESSKTSNAPISLQLADDITASEPVIAVAENSIVNVDFDGNNLTITDGGITAVQSAPGATLTLSNGTIVCPFSAEESDTAVPFISANGGTVILENMLVLTPHASYVVSTGVGGTLLIKDSTINSTNKGAVLVESGATATIDAGTESIAGTLTVEDGTLIIMSGLFTDEPFDYLYSDDYGYSESTDEPNNDGFYEVTYWDSADFEDPFGDDFGDTF